MNWNYENYLLQKLEIIKNREQIDLEIRISNEQAFAKEKQLKPNTIYVIVKYLSNSISYEAITQPIQLFVLTEQNSLEQTKYLFERFANEYNWLIVKDDTTYIKQQYSDPVVLSNFNEVSYGYRSVIYLTGNLLIMEDIADVKDLTIDDNEIKPLSFGINYTMSGNTQPVGNSNLATTFKNVASLSITMTIPMKNTLLVEKIVKIMNGTSSGNTDFKFNFKIDEVLFNNINFKLTSSQIITAPNQVPSLQLGFIL